MLSSQVAASPSKTVIKNDSINVINWGNLYKIYASVEVNTQQKKFCLEIIDGFLRGNEKLALVAHQNLSDNFSLVTLEVTTSNQLNTFFKTESWNYFHSNHKILVLVKKQNKFVGYQYIGMDGEIIPENEYNFLSKVL
jgi:uncharacterized protein (DUF2344 family)